MKRWRSVRERETQAALSEERGEGGIRGALDSQRSWLRAVSALTLAAERAGAGAQPARIPLQVSELENAREAWCNGHCLLLGLLLCIFK